MAGVEQLEWTLTQGDEAKFQLRAGEGVVIGAKATWLRSNEDHPEGVLYLTNQRVLFEQKQNVATKRFFLLPLTASWFIKRCWRSQLKRSRRSQPPGRAFLQQESSWDDVRLWDIRPRSLLLASRSRLRFVGGISAPGEKRTFNLTFAKLSSAEIGVYAQDFRIG